jgi:diguanylate cyclase (GGDEF)-like protein
MGRDTTSTTGAGGSEGAPLPDPRRLVIGSVIAIILLAATVVLAALYAVQTLDSVSVSEEIARAKAALQAVGTDELAEARLNRDYLLDGARFVSPATALRDGEVVVPASDGRLLAWVPHRIGTAMMVHLVPIRIAASAVFLLGMALVVHRLYQLTRELERRRREAHSLALRDPLTGLGNRLAFDRWVGSAAARGVHQVGLLYLDLDDFKATNDRYGHGAGDTLLVTVAKRLSALSGPHDLVARMGGDEFAFVRPGPMDRAALAELAADIGTLLSEPVQIGTIEIALGSSLGAAIGRPDDARLVAGADAALYRAKALPGHTFVLADAA